LGDSRLPLRRFSSPRLCSQSMLASTYIWGLRKSPMKNDGGEQKPGRRWNVLPQSLVIAPSFAGLLRRERRYLACRVFWGWRKLLQALAVRGGKSVSCAPKPNETSAKRFAGFFRNLGDTFQGYAQPLAKAWKWWRRSGGLAKGLPLRAPNLRNTRGLRKKSSCVVWHDDSLAGILRFW